MFSIEDFFRKCEQICKKLQIWSHLVKKSLIENLIFCAVCVCEVTLHFFSNLRTFNMDSKTVSRTNAYLFQLSKHFWAKFYLETTQVFSY